VFGAKKVQMSVLTTIVFEFRPLTTTTMAATSSISQQQQATNETTGKHKTTTKNLIMANENG